jgi:hypothetical protein
MRIDRVSGIFDLPERPMSRQTLVAAFLISCCCYGTTLLAQQRNAERDAATHAPSSMKSDAKSQAEAHMQARARLPDAT